VLAIAGILNRVVPRQSVRSGTQRGPGARGIHKALDAGERLSWELIELAVTALIPLLVFGLGTKIVLGATIGVAPLPIQVVVVLVWLAFLLGLVISVATERFARGNWRRGVALYGQSRWPIVGVLAALTSVLVMAWTTFAGLTCVFRDLGWVHLSPDFPSAECLSRLQDHYAWQFLDAIPAFQIPETLRWAAPYTYTDTVTGALILAYKAAIVLPLIGAYRLWRRVVTEEKGPELSARSRLRRLFA
jgi:hypothetical protein